jgi:hypothetical protein
MLIIKMTIAMMTTTMTATAAAAAPGSWKVFSFGKLKL